MRVIFTSLILLLGTVVLSNAVAPVVVASSTAALPPKPSQTPAMAKATTATPITTLGKEDEAKSVKKGDLAKVVATAPKKNNATAPEESPSEDAQEDLGVVEPSGPTIPPYQIPEQPKDVIVKKKKRGWFGNPDPLDVAVDNALGELFGSRPADTVIEEITYIDYPDRLFKRNKGMPSKAAAENETEIGISEDIEESAIDSNDTDEIKGAPIAVSKSEIEASKNLKNVSDSLKKGPISALPKMEFGDKVTILPSIDEEKDFGSSAENAEELKFQKIAPEVAGLVKKDVPKVEKEKPEEAKSKENGGEKISDEEIAKDKGQKEVVPIYSHEVKEDSDAEDSVEKDESAKNETDSESNSAAEKAFAIEHQDDETSNETADKDDEIVKEESDHQDTDELLSNSEADETEGSKNETSVEVMPIKEHQPKKLSEDEDSKVETKDSENEDEAEEDEAEKSKDKAAEETKDDDDEYLASDNKISEDKETLSAINPASSEIKKESPKNKTSDSENLGEAAYASEIADDDFSIDHKTGLMPAVASSNDDDSSKENLEDYNVMQKLQDDVDAEHKKDQSPDYVVVEELKDPIQGHRKYTILKPTYREFHPKENALLKDVKDTLDQSKIAKRSISEKFETSEESEENNHQFKASFSKDTVMDDSNEVLKNVADAIERDTGRKLKDQEPMFIPDKEAAIPLKKLNLHEILGIPESAGPIMIEPEGGIPKAFKQTDSDSEEEQLETIDYEIPQKVVIQSKQKITLIYDDSSEEAAKDSSSSESSEEEKSQPWIKLQPALEVPQHKEESAFPEPSPLKHSIEDSSSTSEGMPTKQYSSMLGNNLVLTLSISPPMLIIVGVICLTLLLFKIYWNLYSSNSHHHHQGQSSSSPIIPRHTSAANPNFDLSTPLSIVTTTSTLNDTKKQPI